MLCLLLILFVASVHSFAPVKSEMNFNEEQLLRDSVRNETEEEGSGEDVLVSEKSSISPTTTSSSISNTSLLISFPPKPVRCYDISKRCSKIKVLCTKQEYRSIMVRQCAKTCDACLEFSNLPPTSRCRDSFHSCSTWAKNGFCHTTYYTLDERKDYCRKSCEDC